MTSTPEISNQARQRSSTPDFTENAKQVVREWLSDWVPPEQIEEQIDYRLVKRIASFAAEAATAALEQAAQVAEKHYYGDCNEESCGKSIAKDIRALKPDAAVVTIQ